jgi:hypothetical protein
MSSRNLVACHTSLLALGSLPQIHPSFKRLWTETWTGAAYTEVLGASSHDDISEMARTSLSILGGVRKVFLPVLGMWQGVGHRLTHPHRCRRDVLCHLPSILRCGRQRRESSARRSSSESDAECVASGQPWAGSTTQNSGVVEGISCRQRAVLLQAMNKCSRSLSTQHMELGETGAVDAAGLTGLTRTIAPSNVLLRWRSISLLLCFEATVSTRTMRKLKKSRCMEELFPE